MKPLILYHASCSDGFCAAWCARKRFGDDAEYLAVQYGDDPPSFELVGRDVYILDFSYLPEFIEEMAREAKTVTLLDHHQSALERFTEAWGGGGCSPSHGIVTWTPGSNVTLYVDQSRSGAQLAYDYFMGIGPCTTCKTSAGHADNCPVGGSLYRPWIVDYVADRDLWRWKLPQSREINAYLRSIPQDFKAWDALVEAHEDADGYTRAQASGLDHLEVLYGRVSPGPWDVLEEKPYDSEDTGSISIFSDTRLIAKMPLVGAIKIDRDGRLENLPESRNTDLALQRADFEFMAVARTSIPNLVYDVRRLARTPIQIAATLGTAILAVQAREIERAVKRARRSGPLPLGRWNRDGSVPDSVLTNVPYINVTENVSEVLEALAKDPPHWAIGWYQNADGKYLYSLRSRPEGPDVAKIAEAWGGGGHKHAAGFESNTKVL